MRFYWKYSCFEKIEHIIGHDNLTNEHRVIDTADMHVIVTSTAWLDKYASVSFQTVTCKSSWVLFWLWTDPVQCIWLAQKPSKLISRVKNMYGLKRWIDLNNYTNCPILVYFFDNSECIPCIQWRGRILWWYFWQILWINLDNFLNVLPTNA